MGTVIVAINAPLELDATEGGVVVIGFPSNVNEIECEGIKSEPDIVTIVPEFPLDGDSVIAEVVCVNVAVGELVPSEADTSLEPAVPVGTIIVAENAPLELDATEGGVVVIGFPSNVNVMA